MNLFELFVKIGVDDQATDKINNMKTSLSNGLATAAKVGGAAVAATAGGIATLAKKATDAYAQFEQLQGGVETLFGSAADAVLENANKAFATAGVSANQYMETVTSFAASLIQATGRGEQQDLDQLESALDQRLADKKEYLEDEVEATKQALADQLEERKKYWDNLINGETSTDYKKALQDQRNSEIEDLKAENAAKLEERKAYWKSVIEQETSTDYKKALQEQRDAEIAALKSTNTAKLDERKEYWKNVIAIETDKETKSALQAQRDAELKLIKETNDAALAELKQRWKDTIDGASQNNKDLKAQLQSQRDEELKSIKESNDAALAEMKKRWEDTINGASQNTKDLKAQLQAQRDAELESLKKTNSAKLTEMKKQNKATLNLMKSANKDQLEQVKLLNQQSTTTEESLAEAARLADIALQDMSDNANKMGTAMASIQNAYQGFAKQNYTMLDNLKLGYGGTKAEMERLLDTASQLAGVKFDINSYADIVQAIHAIQTEMGITGTTAKEAAGTITGSLSSVKASFENLLVSISSGVGIDKSIKNLFDTAVAFGENYFPRIEQSIEGVIQLIPDAIPMIFEKVPELAEREVPKLVQSATTILDKILEVFSDKESTNKLTNTAVNLITTLAGGFAEMTPSLITGAARIITNLVDILLNPEQFGRLLSAGGDVLGAILEGLDGALGELATSAQKIANALKAYINAPEVRQDIKKGAEDLLNSFLGFLSDENAMITIGGTAGDIVAGLVRGIGNAVLDLLDAATYIFTELDKDLEGEDWDSTADKIMQALGAGWTAFWDKQQPVLDQLEQRMKDWFLSIDWGEVGRKILQSIFDFGQIIFPSPLTEKGRQTIAEGERLFNKTLEDALIQKYGGVTDEAESYINWDNILADESVGRKRNVSGTYNWETGTSTPTQNITINVNSVPLTPSELGDEVAYALTRRAID